MEFLCAFVCQEPKGFEKWVFFRGENEYERNAGTWFYKSFTFKMRYTQQRSLYGGAVAGYAFIFWNDA